jgi:hypothetical protein
MAQPLLLSGGNDPGPDPDLLRRKVLRLEEDLAHVNSALLDARKQRDQALRAMAMLRQNLQPLYDSLRALFGEMEAAGATSSPPSGNPSQPISPSAYDAWKATLPPSCGKMIDALLVQPLKATQLKTMCKLGSGTVSEGLTILKRNGLVDYDGTLYRLKRL